VTDVPPGRGRWRLTVHRRDYSGNATLASTGIAELTDARSRRLEQKLNSPAKLTFSIDGRSRSCANIQELTTDVVAWRWDGNQDIPMFRGVVAQSQDTVTAQAHTVNFTCHDYLAMLARRYLTGPSDVTYTQQDQDAIVRDLVARATSAMAAGAGAPSFAPGSALPITVFSVTPNGANRGFSGTLRDRAYTGGSSIGGLISDLGAVIGGFDFAIRTDTWGVDHLNVYFPGQGVARSDVILAYGPTVAGFTRSVNSADFANYIRTVGDSGGLPEGSAQVYADLWCDDAGNIGAVPAPPVGLWMESSNASDVAKTTTLTEKVHGDLVDRSILVPSYTLTMRPGAYTPAAPSMGDTVPLVLQSGRVDVSTTIRVLGINYAIGDDDQEDVELTVGRPAVDFSALFTETARDVNALARR
jgi:hypothetical protein